MILATVFGGRSARVSQVSHQRFAIFQLIVVVINATPNTYAMSRNVNFWREQRLIFVSTAYLGPMEPISIDIQMETGGRFESWSKKLIFLNFFMSK